MLHRVFFSDGIDCWQLVGQSFIRYMKYFILHSFCNYWLNLKDAIYAIVMGIPTGIFICFHVFHISFIFLCLILLIKLASEWDKIVDLFVLNFGGAFTGNLSTSHAINSYLVGNL